MRRQANPGNEGIGWGTLMGRIKPGTQLAQTQAGVSDLFQNEMLDGSVPLFHGGETAGTPGRGAVGGATVRPNMFFGGGPAPAGDKGPTGMPGPLPQSVSGQGPVVVRGQTPCGPTPPADGDKPGLLPRP